MRRASGADPRMERALCAIGSSTGASAPPEGASSATRSHAQDIRDGRGGGAVAARVDRGARSGGRFLVARAQTARRCWPRRTTRACRSPTTVASTVHSRPPTCRCQRREPGPGGPDRPAVDVDAALRPAPDDVAPQDSGPCGYPHAGPVPDAAHRSDADLPAPSQRRSFKLRDTSVPGHGPLRELDAILWHNARQASLGRCGRPESMGPGLARRSDVGDDTGPGNRTFGRPVPMHGPRLRGCRHRHVRGALRFWPDP